MSSLRRVTKNTTVTQKAYRTLERAIAQNRLTPGQVLVIGDLADELGVSRTPVREALLMLEKAGLVETHNGRMTVSGLSLSDLDEVFEVRQAIEIFCLDKLASRPDRARLSALRRILAPHVGPVTIDPDSAAAADLEFHRKLVSFADNGRLLASWDQMATHLQRFWQDGRANLGRIQSDLAECLALVDAVETGRAEEAATLLRQHLDHTKQALAAWQRQQRGG
jgi:DNA-binding GntR family transcriptional regulator